MSIKDLPADARPREKLLARGPQALSDIELLAILLRTGMAGKNVFQLSEELLASGGIAGLLHATTASLRLVKGLGPAKQAELLAVFEVARRALSQRLQEREAFHTPDAVKHYLHLQLAHKNHEVYERALRLLETYYNIDNGDADDIMNAIGGSSTAAGSAFSF